VKRHTAVDDLNLQRGHVLDQEVRGSATVTNEMTPLMPHRSE
jgi:hypothetical protein